MAKTLRTTRAISQNRRGGGQTQLTRNSTGNGDGTRTTVPSEWRNNPNATIGTFSSTLPRRTRNSDRWPSEQAPPKYDDLFPPSRAPMSRRRARARPSPPEGMDPLVAAMWHNENLSLLLSLPDHLLLKIIGMLSNSGVECIRRVARRFPPLCVREILSPLRGNNPKLSETGPLNWPRLGISSYLRPQFLGLVDRDEYCGGCQAARKSPRWDQRLNKLTEYIHCSACGADHPACLFSATQRLKPARLRYCIGHEGYMRICDHEDGIVRLSRLLAKEPKRPWYKKRRHTFTKARCKDLSHQIECEKVPGGSFPKSKRDCESLSGMCNGRRWPEIEWSEKYPDVFDIYWTAQLPFDGRMDSLRPKLAELRENGGKYIVPRPATAKEPPELRCFDPNDCHCIVYPGAENVRWEWECGPWLPGTTKCIGDSFKGLNTLLPPRPSGSAISNIVRTLKLKRSPECAAEPKRHQSRSERSPGTYGVGQCAVEVRPCHTGKDCLKVDYVRQLCVQKNGKLTPQWYNTLDTSSYNIMADEDGLGVYWCPTPSCRNYYKGIPNYAGILRRREFRKECRHYDCQ